jgi:hypothetical protein
MKSLITKSLVFALISIGYLWAISDNVRNDGLNSLTYVNDDRPIGGSRSIELVGRALHGPGQCIVLNYLQTLSYTGAGGSLLIHNVTNPAQPQFVGSLYTPGILSGIAYNNDICYTADGPAGTVTIDVSNPTQPAIMDQLDIGGWVEEVAIAGNRAYLAAGNGGLKVVDISDPYNLSLVSTINLGGYARDIVVSGNYAYLCGGNNADRWWWIVNLTNNTIVYQKHEGMTEGYFTCVAKYGNYLYVIRFCGAQPPWYTVLEIYNVANPSAPIRCSTLTYENGDASDVQIKKQTGNNLYAYITEGLLGLSVIDVTNPSLPIKIASLQPGANSCEKKLTIKGNYAYLASDHVYIVNISLPANPTITGVFEAGDYARCVWGPTELIQNEDYCGVANWYAGMKLINVSNPYAPYLNGQIQWANLPCEDIQLTSNYRYAYVTTCFTGSAPLPYLKICDLQNPAMPVEIGSLEPNPALTYFACAGDEIYANGQGKFRVIDITQPQNPTIIGSYDWPNPLVVGQEVFVQGTKAYALCKPFGAITGFYIFDISIPSNPVLMGVGGLDQVGNDLYVNGNYGYVVEEGSPNNLVIFDISIPSNPQVISELEIGGRMARGCYVYGNYCFVACSAGLKIADISDPYNPFWVDTYYTPDMAVDVHCARGYVYLTVLNCGLYILRYNPGGTNPEIGGSKKDMDQQGNNDKPGELQLMLRNPALSKARISYYLPAVAQVTINIYDIKGSLIREISFATQSAGTHEMVWDGRRKNGEHAATGVYFVRLETSIGTKTAKLVLH